MAVTTAKKNQVVIETTDNENVPVEAGTKKQVLRVAAVSSDGIKSSRLAPSGIKEPGAIFATEVTRTGDPRWVVTWYHASKADAAHAAKEVLPGQVRKGGPGDVVKARVIAAEAYFVEAESQA